MQKGEVRVTDMSMKIKSVSRKEMLEIQNPETALSMQLKGRRYVGYSRKGYK
jgi:hypothetical protein